MAVRARLAMVAVTALVVAGFGKVHAVSHGYDYSGSSRAAWSIAFVVLLAVAAYASGLPDAVDTARRASVAAVTAVGAGTLGISVVQLFAGDALLPRFVVFGGAPVLVAGYTALGALVARRRSTHPARDRVLLIGEGTEAEMIRRDLALAPERPATLVGWITVADACGDGEHADALQRAVEQSRCSVLVLSRDAQNDDRIVHQVALLHASGVRVRTLALLYEQWLGKLPVVELERVSLLFDISELHREGYLRARRLLDLALCAIGIPLLLVVIPVVLVANAVANRGPLFYRQPRVGKNGVQFMITKFRTMRPAGEGALFNEWTTEDDPRITPVGKLLRRSHLDELPQVFNIVRGDLSFVGPRPEQPHYVEELVAKLPFYELRHVVQPGITGWAQVKYGYAGSESDALEKLQYEFFYLRHQSLAFDLKILARTLRSVFGAKGR